jgi:alkylation response protein AidB-like acyl-CoA dehydrogenase
MYIDYETSKWAAFHAAWLRDQGLSRPDAENALCKLLPTEAAVKNASRLIEIYGALGNDRGTIPQRLLRDAWPLISAAGTSEIMRIVSAGDVIQGNVPREL